MMAKDPKCRAGASLPGPVAPVNDTPNPFALDADRAMRLWAKSEELVGAA